MSRDTRGNPGRITVKDHRPRLSLADVLRRRKTDLKTFIDNLGLTTYAALDIWCGRLGVSAPSEAEFHAVMPPRRLNSAQEGVVILEAPPVVDDISGRQIDPEAPVEQPGVYVRSALVKLTSDQATEPEGTQKKARKKKDDQPS